MNGSAARVVGEHSIQDFWRTIGASVVDDAELPDTGSNCAVKKRPKLSKIVLDNVLFVEDGNYDAEFGARLFAGLHSLSTAAFLEPFPRHLKPGPKRRRGIVAQVMPRLVDIAPGVLDF